MNDLTAVYMQRGECWIAYVEEIPGVNTQGATLDEARENLKEALELVIEVNREIARKNLGEAEVIRETLRIAS